MAWTLGCSGGTNRELVENLQEAGILKSIEVINAMLQTDRAIYVPQQLHGESIASNCNSNVSSVSSKYRYGPYADAPQLIGHKVTISAPYIHATELELLKEKICSPNSRILDVGCGSGILLAYMARMAPSSSKIIGIEIIEDLVSMSIKNLNEDGFRTGNTDDRIVVVKGDGWKGIAEFGPFDAINVGAGANRIPDELLLQLNYDGILLIPIGEVVQGTQIMKKFTKRKQNRDNEDWFLEEETIREVRFVPLIKTTSKSELVNWDLRYKKGWAYGNHPNRFLVDAMKEYIIPSTNRNLSILSLGEGQGRNSVYLASHGHSCTAVDISEVGLSKCMKYAQEKEVSERITAICQDVLSFNPPIASFDVIISIFCMFSSTDRIKLVEICKMGLKEDGFVVILCFSPNQMTIRNETTTQHSKWVLGPPEDCLVSTLLLEEYFVDFEILHSRESKTFLKEGKYHIGDAYLTEFVARKKVNPDLSSSLLSSKSQKESSVFSFKDCMNDLFANISLINIDDICSNVVKCVTQDPLLENSCLTIAIACNEATKYEICRCCWTNKSRCICNRLQDLISKLNVSQSENLSKSNVRLHWIIIIHPNEFLRSISSIKCAIDCLNTMENTSCEFLVFGYDNHMNRLDEIIYDIKERSSETYLLFPNEDTFEDVSIIPEVLSSHFRFTFSEKTETNDVTDSQQTKPYDTTDKTLASNNQSVVNMIVPDGSWECANALVREIEARLSPHRCTRVSLCPNIVSNHFSPLIETIKMGQGLGRISTLEAIALFYKDIIPCENRFDSLMSCLDILVTSIQSCFNEEKEYTRLDINDPLLLQYKEAVQKMMNSSSTMIHVPVGLRRCVICSESMATPSRMQSHIKGKKHCSKICLLYYYAKEKQLDAIITEDILRDIFDQYSTNILMRSIPEPPDVALSQLKMKLTSIPKTKSITKGQISAEKYLKDITHVYDLPMYLRSHHIISFDTKIFEFYDFIKTLLQSNNFLGNFNDSQILEEFKLHLNIFRNFKSRQKLYNTVKNDLNLLKVYDKLLVQVICPKLKRELIAHHDIDENDQVTFHCQYPPTLRIQSGPSEEHGRIHRDVEYGHQVGEVNFWMPITNYEITKVTLHTESLPDNNDFNPVPLNYGEVLMFHGSLCNHYVPMITEPYTRVSMDFRIGIDKYFDSNYEEKDVKAKHGRKLIVL